MTWIRSENALKKTYKFSDFVAALEFVNAIGQRAEEMNHHPDITLRDYQFVDVSITTHDAGYRVTDKDELLAQHIDQIILMGE